MPGRTGSASTPTYAASEAASAPEALAPADAAWDSHPASDLLLTLDRSGLGAALPFSFVMDESLRVVQAGPKLEAMLNWPGLGSAETPSVQEVFSVSQPPRLVAAGGWSVGFTNLTHLWCGQAGLVLESPTTGAQLQGCLLPAQQQRGPCLLFVGLPVAPGGDVRELRVSPWLASEHSPLLCAACIKDLHVRAASVRLLMGRGDTYPQHLPTMTISRFASLRCSAMAYSSTIWPHMRWCLRTRL